MDNKNKINNEKINLETVKIDIKTMNEFMDIGKNQQSFIDAVYGIGEKYATSDITSKLARPAIDPYVNALPKLARFDMSDLYVNGAIYKSYIASIAEPLSDLLDKSLNSYVNSDYFEINNLAKTFGSVATSQMIEINSFTNILNNLSKMSVDYHIKDIRSISNQLNESLKLTNHGLGSLIPKFDDIAKSKISFNSFADMAIYVDEDITAEEIKAFEILDNIKSKDDVKAVEKIIENNKNSNKPSHILFNFVFKLIIALSIFSSSANGITEKYETLTSNNQFVDNASDDSFTKRFVESIIFSAIYDIIKYGVVKIASFIKKKAYSKADNVLKIDKDQLIYIIGEEPYYYKTIYHDENGSLKEGYIAKRNVKILEETDEIEN